MKLLHQQTAEHFALTINRLKGKVMMIFITHQVPKGLQVDEVVNMGQQAMHMSLVREEIT
jgi:subfamily B ATP-binding cassette protein HlyB/CyaB